MFKFVKTLLVLVHLLAQREERKQAEKQKQFKKKQATKQVTLQAEAKRVRAKLNALDSRAATAGAMSGLGSNTINESERAAATLRGQLDYIVPKR